MKTTLTSLILGFLAPTIDDRSLNSILRHRANLLERVLPARRIAGYRKAVR